MTPYYSDDLVTIYHGDAIEFTPRLRADVIVTDPPYGTAAYEADVDVSESLAGWIRRYRTSAIFGWPESLVALCMKAELVPAEWIVWWPSNAEVKGRFADVPVARDSEHIALFGDLIAARGAAVEGVVPHIYKSPSDRARHHTSPKGKRYGDVWRDASPGLGFQSASRRHPNEKPQSVMARLIGMTTGIVLDPFMGSGTTLVAAKSIGRHAVGIEIEERYCEIAAIRCSQEVLGLSA